MASCLHQFPVIDFDALNLTMAYALNFSDYDAEEDLNSRLLNLKVHFLVSFGMEGFCCKSVPEYKGYPHAPPLLLIKSNLLLVIANDPEPYAT
ncbi:uncharacterized protein Bfra_008480 [Botrytis fragariae]|uniref:Uncharacterized protein n=1 Tax=Botrytis fragariae TaxID=1964551 RepID=A0A8H6ATB1_9HELO|nr:uncharacterized protein Bfra_008480 [Botrytis fragariae]KAF5873201.1 hypothetical protein Bfra_008480 [Botrytis fragariae]